MPTDSTSYLSRGRKTFAVPLSYLAALLVFTFVSCNRSSGDRQDLTLVDLVFPDITDQSTGSDRTAPDQASLIQPIVFVFNHPPSTEVETGLIIRKMNGDRVQGEYKRDGTRVLFYPKFPTRPIVQLPGPRWNVGGSGLRPGSLYEVYVPVGTPDATVDHIDERTWRAHDKRRAIPGGSFIGGHFPPGSRDNGFVVRFQTTGARSQFFSGIEKKPPAFTDSTPKDASTDVMPYLYTDPNAVFRRRHALDLRFDAPLDPMTDNVSSKTFKLLEVEDASGRLMNLELGVEVHLHRNTIDGATVRVRPSGILPLGSKLALVYPSTLRGLAGGASRNSGDKIATVFTVSNHDEVARIEDRFREDFMTDHYREVDLNELLPRGVSAEWNPENTGVLRARLPFAGTGELGRFAPEPFGHGEREILLDTDHQAFPLFDGSTPEATPGTVIQGGRFHFTSLYIPEGVVLRAVGTQPLVLTATEDVRIEGRVDVSGIAGTSDFSFDSASTPTPGGPGGPGGGRGGSSNPTVFAIPFFGLPTVAQVPAFEGAHGQAFGSATGGRGGQGGIDTTVSLNCGALQFDNGSRAAGGGGGSFFVVGGPGQDGVAQIVAQSTQLIDPTNLQRPLFTTREGFPFGGLPGDPRFIDASPENDFFGPFGELLNPLGGQGGGGGGNRHDSYYCWSVPTPPFPGMQVDSKGGGGGGGGGALVIRALGEIVVGPRGSILSKGGDGGGGEQIGCSNWGGGGGGGSGGLLTLDSGTRLHLQSGAILDVRGGAGAASTPVSDRTTNCNGQTGPTNPGAGGNGGAGLIQLHSPDDRPPEIDDNVVMTPETSVVDFEKTPSSISARSIAQSTWIDVGQAIRRGTMSPTWSFPGLSETGRVLTDERGRVLDSRLPMKIQTPSVKDPDTGRLLFDGGDDLLPEGASIILGFQSAKAIRPGSSKIDPHSIVPGPGEWSPTIDVGQDRQFVRYRVTFVIADPRGNPLGITTPRPQIDFLELPFDF